MGGQDPEHALNLNTTYITWGFKEAYTILTGVHGSSTSQSTTLQKRLCANKSNTSHQIRANLSLLNTPRPLLHSHCFPLLPIASHCSHCRNITTLPISYSTSHCIQWSLFVSYNASSKQVSTANKGSLQMSITASSLEASRSMVHGGSSPSTWMTAYEPWLTVASSQGCRTMMQLL